MFSREESKKIREDFWIFFGKRYQRKWLLYDTKVKEINLKFSFDNYKAMVSFDIETYDQVFREYYLRSSGKVISRVYVERLNVNIHNKKHWPEVFEFFHDNMEKFELFWWEYQDFITS